MGTRIACRRPIIYNVTRFQRPSGGPTTGQRISFQVKELSNNKSVCPIEDVPVLGHVDSRVPKGPRPLSDMKGPGFTMQPIYSPKKGDWPKPPVCFVNEGDESSSHMIRVISDEFGKVE